ncbi:MAG TPA: class I SAM-dependent methyltransferase, partial [Thermoplasmata archaeon]|nr:class I SAM-dependent methyltransferase [Thermoplasmata archaeon]
FAIDLRLAKRGYEVVGRDLSPEMVRVGQRAIRDAGVRADVAVGDMRTLHLGRHFDAVVCIGTAFNYLTEPRDVRMAFRTFWKLLRPGGILVLDVTNFDAWLDDPMNTRTEIDRQTPSGTRIGIFAFNDQTPGKTLHIARFLTVVQQGRQIEVRFDEAPLKVWSKKALGRALRVQGFRPVLWYGDLAVGASYRRRRSPRLVAVATRP